VRLIAAGKVLLARKSNFCFKLLLDSIIFIKKLHKKANIFRY
jgi:hypothetical protein